MAETLKYYNSIGEVVHFPDYPTSFGDWFASSGESVPAEQQSLLQDIFTILHQVPIASHVRAFDGKLTLEVVFGDGSIVIARKLVNSEDEVAALKLDSEAKVLRWLAGSTDVPVPQVLSPADRPHGDFLIMNKLLGEMLMNIYASLDTSAKERVIYAYATVVLELFRLDIPQKIGTFVPEALGVSYAIPEINVQGHRAPKVFDDIHEYLDFLFDMKIKSPHISGDDGGHVATLKPYVKQILAELSVKDNAVSLFRCVFTHKDLHGANILADKRGNFTGVVDWEYQGLLPAVLAAGYPQWISYTGTDDPRFVNATEYFWPESPEESRRLRNLYLEIVKARDREYWTALVEGARLRSCVQWLLDGSRDPGCKRMKEWMDVTSCGLN